MSTSAPRGNYGTVRVPGIAAICYKFSPHKTLPQGFREVGWGSSYLYATDGRQNPAHEPVRAIVRLVDGTTMEATDARYTTRGEWTRTLNAWNLDRVDAATWRNPVDGRTITLEVKA